MSRKKPTSSKSLWDVVPKSGRENFAKNLGSGIDGPAEFVQAGLTSVVGVQRPLVQAYLRLLSRRHPDADPVVLALYVERDYLRAVTGTGAAGGAAAVIPGVGTGAALALSAGVAVTFLEATALYAQAIAELHGIAVTDEDQAKALVMSVMLGPEAAGLLAGVGDGVAAGRKGRGTWGAAFGTATGKGGSWRTVVQSLQGRFLRHFAASQSIGLVGRAVPFGIGSAIGGLTNRALGKKVIASTLSAFAGLPAVSREELRRVEDVEEDAPVLIPDSVS
ncbi:MAG: hypothetical protein ACTIJJ_13695 [Galactobacter sp.]|uniref:hypothetical protein n=1 Tax=Galactobacter sp. TaxID=2676125 RepID=UPI0025BD9701|nr:hypothetical protein [Galactobacter sp.]